jgi:chemotaxis protein MotB
MTTHHTSPPAPRALLCLLLVAATWLGGCVMASTHKALQKQYDTAQATIAERDRTISEMDAEIARLNAEIAALSASKSNLEAQLATILSDKSRLEASIADMQLALQELEKRRMEAEARVAEYRAFTAKFQKLIDEGKLRIKIRDGRMVVELATDILFESGKADLSPAGILAIQEVSAVLATIVDKKFQVEGHTDNVPINTPRFPSNWELSAARSITVVKTMIEAGMRPTHVSGASYGDSTPAYDNTSEQGRAKNRRIEIVVVPDLSSLPGFNELQRIGS